MHTYKINNHTGKYEVWFYPVQSAVCFKVREVGNEQAALDMVCMLNGGAHKDFIFRD